MKCEKWKKKLDDDEFNLVKLQVTFHSTKVENS